jgi:hypothetical protein
MVGQAEKQRREALCAVENERLKAIEEERQATLEAQAQVEHELKLKKEAELLSVPESILYGRIQGILDTCAYALTHQDDNYTFQFTVFCQLNSLEKSLEEFYADNAKSITVEVVENAQKELRSVLEQWLLSYRRIFPNQQYIDIDSLTEMLFKIAQPTSLWRVELEPISWYECTWDDFVFEGKERIFLLHLGASD